VKERKDSLRAKSRPLGGADHPEPTFRIDGHVFNLDGPNARACSLLHQRAHGAAVETQHELCIRICVRDKDRGVRVDGGDAVDAG
jgi:hypothetical protein